MKKKYVRGSAAACAVIGALLAFNCLIFPQVLAADSPDVEIQSVAANAAPSESADSAVQPDVNAISKEQAIKAALKVAEECGFVDVKDFPCVTIYRQGAAPVNTPVWIVVYKQHIVYEASADDADKTNTSSSKPAAVGSENMYYIFLVDALTGKCHTPLTTIVGDPTNDIETVLNNFSFTFVEVTE